MYLISKSRSQKSRPLEQTINQVQIKGIKHANVNHCSSQLMFFGYFVVMPGSMNDAQVLCLSF